MGNFGSVLVSICIPADLLSPVARDPGLRGTGHVATFHRGRGDHSSAGMRLSRHLPLPISRVNDLPVLCSPICRRHCQSLRSFATRETVLWSNCLSINQIEGLDGRLAGSVVDSPLPRKNIDGGKGSQNQIAVRFQVVPGVRRCGALSNRPLPECFGNLLGTAKCWEYGTTQRTLGQNNFSHRSML